MHNPFQNVKKIEAKPFTSLPAKFRKKRRSAWSDPNRQGATVDSFLEGPSFDRDGNLWCVDIPFGRVFRIDPKGEWELAVQYDGWPNGLKIHKAGWVFIADYRRGLMLLDPKSGKIDSYLATVFSEAFKGLNDLHFADNGDLYFTDQGRTGLHDPTGCVYRYTTAGRLECLINTVPGPNGLVFNVRETELFVAVTRANAVWRVPLDGSGLATRAGLYVQLFSAGPDGLALDENGSVAVAHPGLGTVWVFSKRGEPLHQVKSCAGEMTTNLAYGGENRKTLFITESRSGQILAARMPVAGKAMYSHSAHA